MNLHTKILYITVIILINSTLINGNNYYINNKRKPDTVKWKVHNAEIKKCYVNAKDDYSSAVIRLYKDNFFEYCNYDSKFYRDTGHFTVIGPFLFLKKTNKRKQLYNKNYKSLYFKGFNNLLTISLFHKFKNKSNEKYKLPFYINPNTGIIVKDKNAPNKVNITELVTELTKNIETEQQKFDTITNFICKSIEYGSGDRLKNYQDYVITTLAGRKRGAVCSGYAEILKAMCDIANIKCKVITGAARTDLYDIDHISSHNHAWNIVRIDSIYKIVDLTWEDSNNGIWLNAPSSIMIYSHIPDNEDDQLFNQPIKKQLIDRGPIIMPLYGINNDLKHIPIFSPITGLVYADSIFTFIIDTIINDITMLTTKTKALNMIYNKESLISYESIIDYNIEYDDGKTIISLKMKDLITGVNINIGNSYGFTYKVIKGSKNSYMKLLQEKSTYYYIDSYIKGICASIYLNDKNKLSELVGNNNELFFNNSGNIKNELLEKFNDWDGLTPIWSCTLHITDDYSETINSLFFKDIQFVFEKIDGVFEILAIK